LRIRAASGIVRAMKASPENATPDGDQEIEDSGPGGEVGEESLEPSFERVKVENLLLTEELPLEVPEELVGGRLDKILVALLEDVSRSRIQEFISDGGVLVSDEVETRSSRIVEPGEGLRLVPVIRARERRGAPEGASFDVVYEDEHLIVISKPPGMVAHPSTIVRGGTVSELAVERFGDLPSIQGEDRPGIVHRLDAETSGLMVLAKTLAGGEGMVQLFRDREVQKEYVAVVHFEPRFDSDWIEASIGRAEKRSDRMAVVSDGSGREASTFYETKLRAKGFGFLVLKPHTGRTHQIRVHMSSIDHPLLGDSLYRGRRGLKLSIPAEAPQPQRNFLHARALSFVHPVTGEQVNIEQELPADIAAFLNWMRGK
jgi:23S rRNA pseudouridine1911/1915/1917 synthase